MVDTNFEKLRELANITIEIMEKEINSEKELNLKGEFENYVESSGRE